MRSTRSTPGVLPTASRWPWARSSLRSYAEDERLDALAAALGRFGVARLPRDLGLSDEEFAAAVHLAPSTRPDRYTVLEHLGLDEGQIADRVREFVVAFDR